MGQVPDMVDPNIEERQYSVVETCMTLEADMRGAWGEEGRTISTEDGAPTSPVTASKLASDLSDFIREHPWAVTGASFAVGFLAGSLLPAAKTECSRPPESASSGTSLSSNNEGGSSEAGAGIPPPGVLSRLGEQFGDEIGKVKSVAIGILLGLARDWAARSWPALVPQILDIVDSATRKIGGQPAGTPDRWRGR
jgi:hypothetical protein